MKFGTWNVWNFYRAGSLKRMDLREMRWEGVDWTDLAQDRYHWWVHVKTVMNLRVP